MMLGVGEGAFVSEMMGVPMLEHPYEIRFDLSMNVPPHPVEGESHVDLGIFIIQGEHSLWCSALLVPVERRGIECCDWPRTAPKVSAECVSPHPEAR